MKQILIAFLMIIVIGACKQQAADNVLFELKDNKAIGVTFENNLEFSQEFNVYKYRNYYNGGGVAIGDINNDGLVDIYMVANQLPNHLYLNKGNWSFEDIAAQAGVKGTKAWSTGVTMVDINADGLLDIYVCNSGDIKGDNKENELFINNGDLTFTEMAGEYNLNDKGYSTHASFFDYDKDGDLDAYILNNSFQAIGSFNLRKNERPVRDELGGDKLMRNDGGVFVDVSEEAGIYGSVIGFGLGITIGDVNNDHWEDIFISNDFFERDYLYINQKDGTFKEDLPNQMPSISGASMGADIGDLDNDGWNEIFVTEMLPSDYERLKSVTTFDSWDRYQYNVQNGYHHQFTRNVLHYNNKDNTFSDIGRISGVEASDWSWGALFFDMDNDGYKDLYIANGIYQDLTNQDYLQYIANEEVMASIISDEGVNYKELVDIIPSNMVPNHAYKNMGDLQFRVYEESGLLTPGFSNGAAYGDIDNDGDLDLVVNNVNMSSFFYENKANTVEDGNNYLRIILRGQGENTYAYGAKIVISSGDKKWYYENLPIKGFQSSVDNRATIGLGKEESVDVKIIWPSLKITELKNINTNRTIALNEREAVDQAVEEQVDKPLISLVRSPVQYTHRENRYIDFNREQLIYHMMSTRGPCVSSGDINGDNISDLVIPGPKGSLSTVFMGKGESYTEIVQPEIFNRLKEAEHVKCDLFDADMDGDLDLYLASGGVELTRYSELLYDELLINDGNGIFESSGQRLPGESLNISSGTVCHGDVDQDGDLDLFVGERVKIGEYGAPCSGYILVNDGKGNFSDETRTICSDLENIGMITDAVFADLDADGLQDLVVVGEFMNIEIFKNEGGKLVKRPQDMHLSGWWNVVEVMDMDNDGDLDIIAGNHGLNSRFKATPEHPIRIYYNDYDKNGFPEGIITQNRNDGKDYPFALRHNLMTRLPGLKKQYPDFESFKNASIEDIFSPEILAETTVSEVNEMRTLVLINNGGLSFEKSILPYSTQLSPVYAICAADVNNDGFMDILMGGNLFNVQPEVGRYDASYGHILLNDGTGQFTDRAKELGFSVKGEIRDIIVDKDKIHVFRNNDEVLSFQINRRNNEM